MTLQELRYLVAVADHGHFGRAAAACHVSQPTLSMQLRKLEDLLGATLVERSNKQVVMTALGQKVVDHARRILAEAEAIRSLTQHQQPLSGDLKLGIIPTLAPHLLPWLLPLLQRHYAHCRLVPFEDMTANLIAALKRHEIEAALLALPLATPLTGLNSLILFDEPFLFTCPSSHALSDAAIVDPETLAAVDLLLLSDGHCLRDQALALCQRPVSAGDGADFRASSLQTICQMVRAGHGCTLLPALAAEMYDDPGLALRPMTDAAFRRIALVHRRESPRIADFALLADLIRAQPPRGTRNVDQS